MIRVDGVHVRRVLIPELADQLIHAGENQLASRLLTASAEQRDVDLTEAERAAIVRVLERTGLEGFEHLRVALAGSETDPAQDV